MKRKGGAIVVIVIIIAGILTVLISKKQKTETIHASDQIHPTEQVKENVAPQQLSSSKIYANEKFSFAYKGNVDVMPVEYPTGDMYVRLQPKGQFLDNYANSEEIYFINDFSKWDTSEEIYITKKTYGDNQFVVFKASFGDHPTYTCVLEKDNKAVSVPGCSNGSTYSNLYIDFASIKIY
jgi:PDZ domain-containing secreted protein